METLSTAPWSFLLSPRGRRVPTKLHITEGDTGKHFPHGVLGVEPLPYPGTGNSGKHFPLVGRHVDILDEVDFAGKSEPVTTENLNGRGALLRIWTSTHAPTASSILISKGIAASRSTVPLLCPAEAIQPMCGHQR